MSLQDYSPMRGPDRFSIRHAADYTVRGSFAFPCCVCDSQDVEQGGAPCNDCGHNEEYQEKPATDPPRRGSSRIMVWS